MDGALWFVGIFVVGGILFAIQQQAATAPGRKLHEKFVKLGNLQGRSKRQILVMVGQPTSISHFPEGKTLLQWQATGFHIARRFTGEICEGITHEHLHQG